jgi:hypothetical protein
MSVDPARSDASAWTFGLRLCLAQTGQSAVIRQVGPAATLGSGFRDLGIGIRMFEPTLSHEPIISVPGFPPPTDKVPDSLANVSGFEVATPCTNTPRQQYTELLIGLGKIGDDGGGWKGIKVDYEVDGRSFTLLIDHDLLVCGKADPVC